MLAGYWKYVVSTGRPWETPGSGGPSQVCVYSARLGFSSRASSHEHRRFFPQASRVASSAGALRRKGNLRAVGAASRASTFTLLSSWVCWGFVKKVYPNWVTQTVCNHLIKMNLSTGSGKSTPGRSFGPPHAAFSSVTWSGTFLMCSYLPVVPAAVRFRVSRGQK